MVLILDEMHIKEDLVYDKHTGELVGFTNLGSINQHLQAFEKHQFGATCKFHARDDGEGNLH